ncbi:MAG: hypothetical protein ACRC2R_06015 [Xenococcaceae cyanobacterium]
MNNSDRTLWVQLFRHNYALNTAKFKQLEQSDRDIKERLETLEDAIVSHFRRS